MQDEGKRNKIERKRQAWLARHTSSSHAAPWLTDEGIPNEELKLKFLSHKARTGHTPDKVWGVFGEQSGRDGWIEQIIKRHDGVFYTKDYSTDAWKRAEKEDWFPNQDGAFIKLYGCSYLFKGSVPQASVHGIEMAKIVLFQVVPQLPLFTFLGLGFDFLFRRQRFWTFMDWLGSQIHHRCLRHYDIPAEEYNVFAKELSKAFVLALYKVWKIDITRPYYDMDHPNFRPEQELPHLGDNFGKNRLGYILARFWTFVVFFLQQDFAYRSRIQDALGTRPKNLEQFLNVLITRETKFGVGYKWKFLLKGIHVILFLEPKLKEATDAFFHFVDFEKVQQDEADRYFSLMYRSYNFQGKPFEERKKEWDRLNIEKGMVFLFSMPDVI